MPLPPRSPDAVSLDLLASVAATGSLGRAAELHGISQPAASLRIRALERVLGVTLLERSARGSRLTAAGSAVVNWADPVLEGMQALVAGVEALRERRERLRVSASMTVAEYLLPGWLVALRRRRPEVTIALHVDNSEQVATEVREGRARVGFIESARMPAGLRHQTIDDDVLVVVVAPGHRWAARRRPLPPDELAATPLVSRERGSGTRDVLEEALSARGLTPSTVVELASTTAIKAAVMGGVGPAVLSRLAVTNELAGGGLVEVPLGDLRLCRPLSAVWHPDRGLDADARTLVEVATLRAAQVVERPTTGAGSVVDASEPYQKASPKL